MRSVKPKEVGVIFRDYARKIHAKAVTADPNFLRISIACGKVRLSFFLPSSSLSSSPLLPSIPSSPPLPLPLPHPLLPFPFSSLFFPSPSPLFCLLLFLFSPSPD